VSKPLSKRITRRFGLLACAAMLAGCALMEDEGAGTRGFVLDEQLLEQIKPGASAEQVVLVLGTPSTTSTVGGKAYYYISQKVSQRFQFMEQKVVDQRVVAIYLDDKNKVERVANYGMQDGKIFDFVSRTTPSAGQDTSILGNIFRRIGAPAA
jgi:outer membrane protein assembly factor BamE (lipoprotein component of BamABCDE complex)